jgi:hypothetical protein
MLYGRIINNRTQQNKMYILILNYLVLHDLIALFPSGETLSISSPSGKSLSVGLLGPTGVLTGVLTCAIF